MAFDEKVESSQFFVRLPGDKRHFLPPSRPESAASPKTSRSAVTLVRKRSHCVYPLVPP